MQLNLLLHLLLRIIKDENRWERSESEVGLRNSIEIVGVHVQWVGLRSKFGRRASITISKARLSRINVQ